MSDKDKIAELEKLIESSFEKFNEVVQAAREDLDELVNNCNSEIVELKKQDEVKPVFPDYVPLETTFVMVANSDIGGAFAKEIGLTAHNEEGRMEICARLTARAYVIEAINKANKGDNGFKVGRL